jgi:hypothetical protein
MGKTSPSAKERYNKKAYDDVRLRVPRGAGSFIRMAAKLQSRSVNAYICAAILEKMKLSKWPAGVLDSRGPSDDLHPGG